MFKQKRFAIVLGVVFVATSALSAQGFRRHGHHGRGGFGPGGFMGPMFAEMLDLTEEQQAQAEEIRAAAKAEAAPIREELKAGREAMREAVRTNNIAEIENLAAQKGELLGQLTATVAKGHAEFLTLLTPEQLETLESFHERMEERREKRRHRWGGPPAEAPESEL